MADLHVSLDHTWKSRISKISTRCQIFGGVGVHSTTSDPELRNEVKNFSNPGGIHSMEWSHSQDLTLFPFCCVHHHRSFLTKDQSDFCVKTLKSSTKQSN